MNTIFNKCNKVVNCNIHSFGEIFNEFNSINNDYNNTNCSNASVISNTDINKSNKHFTNFIGIDVGKYKLDIYCSFNNTHYSVLNKENSIKEFIDNILLQKNKCNKNIKNNQINKNIDNVIKLNCNHSNDINNSKEINYNNTLIVIDLTGGYEILCRDTFYNMGFTNIHLAEGIKVKYFSKSILKNKAKTDKIDSKMLVLYAERMINDLRLYNKTSEDLNKLNEYVERIYDLKDMKQKEKNRLEAPRNSKLINKTILSCIKTLEKQIEEIEKEILYIIEHNPELNKIYKLLLSIKGIGQVIAYTILSHLPELGKVNRRQIASISGCAPKVVESCSIHGYRRVMGGRPIIKQMLFNAILVRIRTDEETKEKYEYFQSKGKKKMVAIVALMRKLIVSINAKVKELLKEEIVIKDNIQSNNISSISNNNISNINSNNNISNKKIN